MPPMTVKIKVGESGTQFLQRNQLDSRGNVDRQPAGINFHEHDWPTGFPGTVSVEHGPHSFEIQHALSVLGMEDVEKPEEGLSKFSINAGITAADYVLHDEARIAFIDLLQILIQKGWKLALTYGTPRLSGEQAFRNYLEDRRYAALPIDYSPTLDEWMQIDSGTWRLYAGDLFLKINMRRDSKRMNPQEPGGYLLTFSLYSKEERGRQQVFPSERDRWKELWVERVKALKKERYALEERLIRQGYTIDTGYVEPLVHPADPVEP